MNITHGQTSSITRKAATYFAEVIKGEPYGSGVRTLRMLLAGDYIINTFRLQRSLSTQAQAGLLTLTANREENRHSELSTVNGAL